jgi:hypothetical protein
MKKKYIIWYWDDTSVFGWEEQGEGPLTLPEADRIARELRQDCHVRTRVLPVGVDPRKP